MNRFDERSVVRTPVLGGVDVVSLVISLTRLVGFLDGIEQFSKDPINFDG